MTAHPIRNRLRYLLLQCILLLAIPVVAEKPLESAPDAKESNFLQRKWYADQGVELPRMFGAGINVIYMKRDIEVVDVSVAVGNSAPQSISDRAEFDVGNETMLSMARFDVWALPFLNVYAMLGETRTDTSISTRFEVTPPLGGAPVPVEVIQNQKVSGPLYGGGATLVYGGSSWFCMADANYSRSDLDSFDGTLDAWYLSSRLGWHASSGRFDYKAWGGIAYLASSRTLSLTLEQPALGTIKVDVEQRPANPWNAAIGGSISYNRHWDLMVELGSNFEDAIVVVLAGSYRF